MEQKVWSHGGEGWCGGGVLPARVTGVGQS